MPLAEALAELDRLLAPSEPVPTAPPVPTVPAGALVQADLALVQAGTADGHASTTPATARPLLVETLWRGGPATLVRTGTPEAADVGGDRGLPFAARRWPLGPPVVEHLRLARVERRTVPGGEAVYRLHLADGGVVTRGPLAPLLLVDGHRPLVVRQDLAGAALWADLELQAGLDVLLFLPPPADPPKGDAT